MGIGWFALFVACSLLFSTFVFTAHAYLDIKEIRDHRSRFKLEDFLLLFFICYFPIGNILMAVSILFRVWSLYDLNNVLTELIRKEK